MAKTPIFGVPPLKTPKTRLLGVQNPYFWGPYTKQYINSISCVKTRFLIKKGVIWQKKTPYVKMTDPFCDRENAEKMHIFDLKKRHFLTSF